LVVVEVVSVLGGVVCAATGTANTQVRMARIARLMRFVLFTISSPKGFGTRIFKNFEHSLSTDRLRISAGNLALNHSHRAAEYNGSGRH